MSDPATDPATRRRRRALALGVLAILLWTAWLGVVRPLSARYSNLEPTQSFVAEIVIRRLDKSGGAPG